LQKKLPWKTKPTPKANFISSREVLRKANVKEYETLYQQSIDDREGFWAAEAKKLDWFKKWDKVLDDSKKPFYRWFTGGRINIVDNALDRHQKNATRNKLAIIWEGEPGMCGPFPTTP